MKHNNQKIQDALFDFMPICGIRTIIIDYMKPNAKSPLNWIKQNKIVSLLEEYKIVAHYSPGVLLKPFFNIKNAYKRKEWINEQSELVSKENCWGFYLGKNQSKRYLVLNLDLKV